MALYLKPVAEKLLDSKSMLNKMSDDDKILSHLLEVGITKTEIMEGVKDYYSIDYTDLANTDINNDILKIENTSLLKNRNVIIYKIDEQYKRIYFALQDIFDESLIEVLNVFCKGLDCTLVISYATKGEIQAKYKELEGYVEDDKSLPSSEIPDDNYATNFLNRVMNNAIDYNASDIHIEPLERGIQVRYRIDGILTKKEFHDVDSKGIINRTKILSNINIAEKRKAQDGRIDNYTYKGNKYDLRVSSVMGMFGEKIVMRIFNKTSKILTFEQLGFSDSEKDKILKMLHNANGIIFLAGATGSGKTTSLYTMIDAINSDKINIYTIEDPVEKTVDNVTQIQMNDSAGVTYAATLKALLRQDPDVIVVGETRDSETADLAVRSSLTGHLVLTTIHANNAVDTITRIADMGVERYLLGASSLGFISQRLIRKLCPHCKQKEDNLEEYELAWLDSIKEEYGETLDGATVYRAVGCEHCNDGFKGRTALTETLVVTDNTRKLITKGTSVDIIMAEALKEGFRPLKLNGLSLIKEGSTTIKELMRQI